MEADVLIARGLEVTEKYATARAEAEYLEHFRRVKLAMLMRNAEHEGCKSVAAQEREALAHPDYTTFLRGLQVAQEKAEKLRWECKIMEWEVELTRTQEASKRAELKVLQG